MAEVTIPARDEIRRRTRTYDSNRDNFNDLIEAISSLLVPAGSLVPTMAASEPDSGWKLCNGQSLLRADYPRLFAVIGTQFGGSGTDSFTLPDLRGRMLMGVGAAWSPALMNLIGAAQVTLNVANLPAHSHGITDPGHSHTFTPTPHTHTAFVPDHSHTGGATDAGGESQSGTGATRLDAANTSTESLGVTVDSASAGGTISTATTGVTVDNTGSGDPVDNIPPVMGINWLVRT